MQIRPRRATAGQAGRARAGPVIDTAIATATATSTTGTLTATAAGTEKRQRSPQLDEARRQRERVANPREDDLPAERVVRTTSTVRAALGALQMELPQGEEAERGAFPQGRVGKTFAIALTPTRRH